MLLSDDRVHVAMFCCDLKEESRSTLDIVVPLGPKERSWSPTQLLSYYLISEKLLLSLASLVKWGG